MFQLEKIVLYFILQKLKDPYSLFDQMLDIYVSQSQRMFENQGLITDLKHIPTLINDWENNIA